MLARHVYKLAPRHDFISTNKLLEVSINLLVIIGLFLKFAMPYFR